MATLNMMLIYVDLNNVTMVSLADPRWRLRRALPSRSNFFHFHALFSKNLVKQECIPVGCLPPAAVAVCWGVYLPGVSCDLSRHAFDVTCMLPPHQLRHQCSCVYSADPLHAGIHPP